MLRLIVSFDLLLIIGLLITCGFLILLVGVLQVGVQDVGSLSSRGMFDTTFLIIVVEVEASDHHIS